MCGSEAYLIASAVVCWEACSIALLSNAPFPSRGKYPQVQFSVLAAPSKSSPVCEQPFLRKMQHSQLPSAGILHSLGGPSTHTIGQSRGEDLDMHSLSLQDPSKCLWSSILYQDSWSKLMQQCQCLQSAFLSGLSKFSKTVCLLSFE